MTIEETPKPWIVQKYGGTSLGKLLDKICDDIIPSFTLHTNVAVVCSAISGATKSSGTTSQLLKCISYARSHDKEARAQLIAAINLIKDNHLTILNAILRGTDEVLRRLQKDVSVQVTECCEQVLTFLLAAQTVAELSPRSVDRVLALGEKLSCLIVSTCLTARGFPATPIYLDTLVEDVFGSSLTSQNYAFETLGSEVYTLLSRGIASKIQRVQARGPSIPIITGFFGIVPSSLLETVGRGYSDLCAALCAVGLQASELQIWKEVDGIYTADPRKIPEARLLRAVTFEEASELTYYGSEVIHPLTMAQVQRAGIRLQLKNVFNPLGHGTRIYPSSPSPPPSRSTNTPPSLSAPATPPTQSQASVPSPSFLLTHGYHTIGPNQTQTRRTPTAITTKDNIRIINVISTQSTKSPLFLMQVFQKLAKWKVDIDLVTSSEKSVSLAVGGLDGDGDGLDAKKQREESIERLRQELEEFGTVAISGREERAIVSVVGMRMRNVVGVSNEIFSALAAAKINVYMISQGASEINISFVVKAEDALLAMEVVHRNVLKIPTNLEVENNFIKGPWLY